MIRQVGPEDWADWRLLRRRSLTEDPEAFASSVLIWTGDNDTEVRWRARLAADACFVAYVDDQPVGMVAGMVGDDGVQLISMWVAPEARKRGVGRALISAVIGWSASRPLSLRVVDGNAAALGAYRQQGFVLQEGCADAEGCRTMVWDRATAEREALA